MTVEPIDLGFVKVWRDEEGVLRLVYAPGASLTVREIQATAFAMRELSEGKKRPVFVDARGLRSIDREARAYALSEESATEWIIALATLNTPINKLLADLYTKLNRPPYPLKYFVSEAQALEWLRSFLEDERK